MCRQVFKSLQVPNSLLVLLILRMYDTSLPPPLAVFLSSHFCRSSLLLSFCLFLPNSLTLSLVIFCHIIKVSLSRRFSFCESKVLSAHFVGQILYASIHACGRGSWMQACGSPRYQITLPRQMHQLKYAHQCSCWLNTIILRKKSARTINSFKAWPIVELLKGKKEKDREWVGGLGGGRLSILHFPR